jgi:membrane protein
MILGLVLAAALIVGVPIALGFLAFSPMLETAIQWLSYVPLALLVVAGLAILYRFGPDRKAANWAWLTPGAVIATVLWLIASLGFRVYVQNFASYNETFGSIAGVIVVLTWMWISAIIFLLGAEVNSELEAQTVRDTTTGPREPMGERGAVKADRLGRARG